MKKSLWWLEFRITLAFDQSLKYSTDLGGMKFFQREDPVLPLMQDQTWFFVETSSLPENIQQASHGHALRNCIEEKDGSTRFEVLWSKRKDGCMIIIDMGSASWPIQGANYDGKRGRLAGWWRPDPPHRRHRHSINAIERADLKWAFGEVNLELAVGTAPFGRSGFHWARGYEFFSEFTPEHHTFKVWAFGYVCN